MSSELSNVDPDRNPVDVLADEFAMRYRRGETPSITEYVQRFPEHADEIQSLFPSVALLEQLGSRPEADARPERQGSLPPHHQIGDFEILREIGRGGMGVVYEAVQQSLHRPVALKVLNTASLHSENQAKRFEREAQAAAQLHHTNIVPVFGVGEQDGLRYYVMQRIHGLGLDAVLAELSGSYTTLKGHHPRYRDDTVSAQALAGVLVSGELSKSSAIGVSIDRSQAGTSQSSALKVDATSRSAAGENSRDGDTLWSDGATPSDAIHAHRTTRSPVPSSLILRDDPSAAGVRSSLILRDDFSGMIDDVHDPAAHAPFPNDADESGRAAVSRTHSFGRRYWRNIARIGMQVASGLQYAHSQGTLHRDIKPANVLLDTDGTAWIADFGLAKVLEAENVTHTGDVVGTLRYMAPEQFQGEANTRSDIYSLGLTLFELLTLRPAYDETDRQKLIARKLTPHEPQSLRKWAPDVPRDLETIVHKCLAYEAVNRYASAGALLADLQAFVEDRPIQARQATSIERLWRWCRRNPAIAGLSGTVACLLVLTAALTSAGYVQQKRLAEEQQERATEERILHTQADEARQNAERIAQLAFQAFDNIGQSFVSDDAIGTIELEDEESDEQFQVPAYSPETASIMERLRSSFDELAEVAGEDRRFLGYAAKADLRAGELHLRLNQWDQAEDAFSRAIMLYEELDKEPDDAETRLRLAKLYNGLSVAYVYLRESGKSQDAQQRALTLLSEDVSGPDMKFELARTHYLMGCHFQGIRAPDGPPRHDAKDDDSPQAERDGDPKIMTVSRETDAEGDRPTGPPPPPRPFHRRSERDRPDHQGSHGPRHREEREHWWRDLVRREQENREHLEQAATLFAELTNAHPSVSHYQYWLALCYLELAKHFSQPAESEEAPERDEGRKRAVEILEALVDEHPQKADYLYQLSEAYELSYRQIIGIGRWPKGNWEDESRDVTPEQLEQVEHDLRSALRVSDRLIVQQPHIPGYAFSNFALMMRLMEVLEEREDYRGALAIWERLKASRETFADLFPKFRHFGGEADPGPDPVREFFRANILMKEGKFPEARTLLESITGRFEDRPHRSGRRWHWHRWMADVYELLESCLIELGDTEEAAKIREKREALHRDDDRGD